MMDSLEDIIKEVNELKERLAKLEEFVNIIGERLEDLSRTADELRSHTGCYRRYSEHYNEYEY
jgi:FtsZ-binding cell division protein ZapB